MIIWALVYQFTVGTVCYSLVVELSTRRLQIRTVMLGRNLYNIVGIICSVLTPHLLNSSAWNWQNYAGFFWAGICFLCIIYTYFRILEPRGRTFAEPDLLFERNVPARKFATTQVDTFDERVDEHVIARHRDSVAAVQHVEREKWKETRPINDWMCSVLKDCFMLALTKLLKCI